MAKFKLLTLGLFVLIISATNSRAGIIVGGGGPPPETTAELDACGPCSALVSYNAPMELFGASGGPEPFQLWQSPLSSGSNLLAQFDATFTLAANIDNSGKLLNGSFSLTGTNVSLGITTPTTLLSGNLIDMATCIGSDCGAELQFLASDLIFNNAVETLTGDIAAAYIDFYAIPAYRFDDFSSSFGPVATNDTSPFIYLVPEPPSLPLFAAGLIGFLALGARIVSIQARAPHPLT